MNRARAGSSLRLLALVAAIALTSCAATLRLSAVAPTEDEAGICNLRPRPVPGMSERVWVHFAWSGQESGRDSVWTMRGQRAYLNRSVAAGSYIVRAWASNEFGAGCDTTITVATGYPPAKVTP